MDFEIRAHSAVWNDTIEFLLRRKTQTGYEMVSDLILETTEPGKFIPHPSFSLSFNEGQSLMDQLWVCGLRPTEGTGSAGSLKATENHLADMQKIVFKKLGI